MVVYLGLGSNLGDREANLRNTASSLANCGLTVLRSASLYWTEPRDVTDQPWFLNTVLEADTMLPPQELLRICLEVERRAGRIRDAARGPRVIDIDILLYDAQVIRTPELSVPHPRYADRRFVLAPLAELIPEFRDPVRKLTIQELLARCPDSGVVRPFGPPLL